MTITLKNAQKHIDKRMQALAAERDRLSALMDDLEYLREQCSEAYDSLERAHDALNEVV